MDYKNIYRFVPGVTTHNNSGFKSKDEKEPGTETRRKPVQALMLLKPTRLGLGLGLGFLCLTKLCLTVSLATDMQPFLWAWSSSRKIQDFIHPTWFLQQNWSMCVHVCVCTYWCIWVSISHVTSVVWCSLIIQVIFLHVHL